MRTRPPVTILLLGGLLSGAPAQAAPRAVRGDQSSAPALDTASPPSAVAVVGEVAPGPVRAFDTAALEERWGIQVVGLYLTAGDYMLDFRYRVVDPVKAAPLFERKSKPVLKDEKTGAIVMVPVPPKTGALRNSNPPQAGRTYFMFFANPARFIQRYRLVTVTIGPFSVSGLTVR